MRTIGADLLYQDDLYRLFSTPVVMRVKNEITEEMKEIVVEDP